MVACGSPVREGRAHKVRRSGSDVHRGWVSWWGSARARRQKSVLPAFDARDQDPVERIWPTGPVGWRQAPGTLKSCSCASRGAGGPRRVSTSHPCMAELGQGRPPLGAGVPTPLRRPHAGPLWSCPSACAQGLRERHQEGGHLRLVRPRGRAERDGGRREEARHHCQHHLGGLHEAQRRLLPAGLRGRGAADHHRGRRQARAVLRGVRPPRRLLL